MVPLNKTGKRRLIVLILQISVVGLLCILGYINFNIILASTLLPLWLLPIMTYYSYQSKVKNSITNQLLKQIGFIEGETKNKTIYPEDVERYKLFDACMPVIDRVGRATISGHEVTLIIFSLTIGSDNQVTYKLIGFESNTTSNISDMQLFDNSWAIRLISLKPLKLESLEFNRMFTVATDDPKHAYSNLGPDTMYDLIENRINPGLPFGIEYKDNKVFIYTTLDSLEEKAIKSISFLGILNDSLSLKDSEVISNEIKLVIECYRKVWTALKIN